MGWSCACWAAVVDAVGGEGSRASGGDPDAARGRAVRMAATAEASAECVGAGAGVGVGASPDGVQPGKRRGDAAEPEA